MKLASLLKTKNTDMVFKAYGRGKLQGIYTDFSDAVKAAYEVMGFVTDGNQKYCGTALTGTQ